MGAADLLGGRAALAKAGSGRALLWLGSLARPVRPGERWHRMARMGGREDRSVAGIKQPCKIMYSAISRPGIYNLLAGTPGGATGFAEREIFELASTRHTRERSPHTHTHTHTHTTTQ